MKNLKFNGNKLSEIRRKKEMSQEKLGELLGVTRQTIYLWESNQTLPDIEKVGKMCEIFEKNFEDFMDGRTNLKRSENSTVHKKINLRKFLKFILIVLLLIFIFYFINCNIKFIRLNKILTKWKDLNNLDNYYVKIIESSTDKNSILKEDICYEKYYKNKILKTVIKKNSETEEISTIIIRDFNTKEMYIINEDEKIYRKEKLDFEDSKLINNLNFGDNMFINYIYCFIPSFSIKNSVNYILKFDSTREIISKNTGLISREEYFDKDSRFPNRIRTYYTKINTDEEFDIDLNNYKEVTY